MHKDFFSWVELLRTDEKRFFREFHTLNLVEARRLVKTMPQVHGNLHGSAMSEDVAGRLKANLDYMQNAMKFLGYRQPEVIKALRLGKFGTEFVTKEAAELGLQYGEALMYREMVKDFRTGRMIKKDCERLAPIDVDKKTRMIMDKCANNFAKEALEKDDERKERRAQEVVYNRNKAVEMRRAEKAGRVK